MNYPSIPNSFEESRDIQTVVNVDLKLPNPKATNGPESFCSLFNS